MILDVVIVMDIETARHGPQRAEGFVSCIYVEGTTRRTTTTLAAAIEKAHPASMPGA